MSEGTKRKQFRLYNIMILSTSTWITRTVFFVYFFPPSWFVWIFLTCSQFLFSLYIRLWGMWILGSFQNSTSLFLRSSPSIVFLVRTHFKSELTRKNDVLFWKLPYFSVPWPLEDGKAEKTLADDTYLIDSQVHALWP